MSLLSRQLRKLVADQLPSGDSGKDGEWMRQGASNATYRAVVTSLVAEITLLKPRDLQLEASTSAKEGEMSDATQIRQFYFNVINGLVKGSPSMTPQQRGRLTVQQYYPMLVEDVFGFENTSQLLDALCGDDAADEASSIEESEDVRQELVRFLAAEASSFRLGALQLRKEKQREEEEDKKRAEEASVPSADAPSAPTDQTALADNRADAKAKAPFTHEDARFVLCLLQELNPTTATVAQLEKTSNALIHALKTNHKDALTPIFLASKATEEQKKTMELIRSILVDDFTLRWATQLERMQCTLRAFTDIETELLDAPSQKEEGVSNKKKATLITNGVVGRKGGINPSSVLTMERFAEMKAMLAHASGILERFFDYPCIAIEGDLLAATPSSSSTLCVGMVNAAFAPISLFRKRTNFAKRNAPLVPVPDRGGRTNVGNFDRAVSSSSRQKDMMMRQGSGGGGGGGGRGGGGRGGGGGSRHADPNKSADQVRSGGGNWSGRGAGKK